jgi:hypothetical protein
MVESFLLGKSPSETWKDGVSCLELIMACYMSSEKGRKIRFPPTGVEDYVPAPARGSWNPKDLFHAV